MSGPDALFTLGNNFYLGAYQAAINESSLAGLSEADALERDSLVYRSYIAQGSYQLVLDEISLAAPTALQAVRLLALYLSGKKEEALTSLKELLGDTTVATTPTLLLVAGTIYAQEENYVDALKFTHSGATMELMALNVQIFLKMDRPEHAEKQLKAMQQMDEDHTLTQLANAWVNLALGGAKIQEASYIFQELCEKFTWTPPLMNGSAVCNMQMGRYDEAESLLLEALNKDAKDPDTLANLIVCDIHLAKPYTRYMNQLKTLPQQHVILKRFASAEKDFDESVAAFV